MSASTSRRPKHASLPRVEPAKGSGTGAQLPESAARQRLHDAPENANTGDYIRLLEYRHNAMESRRGIELKIFTGIVALFLIITKGLHDAISQIETLPLVPWILGLAFITSDDLRIYALPD
jgi:hypothetical protein